MEIWKIQLVVVTFCLLVQTCRAASTTADGDRGPSQDREDESVEVDLIHPLVNLMKRSKALRFYGLMGKRSGLKKPFQVRRRNKGDTFVGLMGRSISSGEALNGIIPYAATAATNALEKPQKQGSSEERVQILY